MVKMSPRLKPTSCSATSHRLAGTPWQRRFCGVFSQAGRSDRIVPVSEPRYIVSIPIAAAGFGSGQNKGETRRQVSLRKGAERPNLNRPLCCQLPTHSYTTIFQCDKSTRHAYALYLNTLFFQKRLFQISRHCRALKYIGDPRGPGIFGAHKLEKIDITSHACVHHVERQLPCLLLAFALFYMLSMSRRSDQRMM